MLKMNRRSSQRCLETGDKNMKTARKKSMKTERNIPISKPQKKAPIKRKSVSDNNKVPSKRKSVSKNSKINQKRKKLNNDKENQYDMYDFHLSEEGLHLYLSPEKQLKKKKTTTKSSTTKTKPSSGVKRSGSKYVFSPKYTPISQTHSKPQSTALNDVSNKITLSKNQMKIKDLSPIESSGDRRSSVNLGSSFVDSGVFVSPFTSPFKAPNIPATMQTSTPVVMNQPIHSHVKSTQCTNVSISMKHGEHFGFTDNSLIMSPTESPATDALSLSFNEHNTSHTYSKPNRVKNVVKKKISTIRNISAPKASKQIKKKRNVKQKKETADVSEEWISKMASEFEEVELHQLSIEQYS